MTGKRLLTLLIILVIIPGCSAAIDKEMASWVGHNQNDLIAQWGAPQQTLDDGMGGKILVFSQSRSYTSPGTSTTNVSGSAYTAGSTTWGNATGKTTYNPPQTTTWSAQRMFWIDRNGRVYRWAWKGL